MVEKTPEAFVEHIINTGLIALAKQDRRAHNGKGCQYRLNSIAEDPIRCLIGHCIANEFYNEDMEGGIPTRNSGDGRCTMIADALIHSVYGLNHGINIDSWGHNPWDLLHYAQQNLHDELSDTYFRSELLENAVKYSKKHHVPLWDSTLEALSTP